MIREGLSLRCALRRGPATTSDESLLRLAAAGDAEAFAELYRRRLPIVVGFLRRHTATAEVAADLAAETFVAALSYLQSGGALPSSAIAWLLTIARNKLIDSLRRGRVEDAARSRLHLERLELTDEDLEAVERMSAQMQDLPRCSTCFLPSSSPRLRPMCSTDATTRKLRPSCRSQRQL